MAGAAFWHWWVFGGLLVMVEAFAPGYMLLWFGVAAGLVGLVLVVWPALTLSVQLLLYAGLLLLCGVGWRWYQRAWPVVTDQPDLNRRGEQLVGRRFRLVTPIVNGRGRVEAGDGSWAVAGPDLPSGRIVEVTGIDGTVLEVRLAEPQRVSRTQLEDGGHAASPGSPT